MEQITQDPTFPSALLDWAGHRAGGVRKIFYTSSGRPSGAVIRTGLIKKLEEWTKVIASNRKNAPNILLLVGGPGNGKTESVEFTVKSLDAELGLGGKLVNDLTSQFLDIGDNPSPRLARVDLALLTNGKLDFDIAIVQDASVSDQKTPNLIPAELLLKDLEDLEKSTRNCVYIACVNRGILDDALIAAIEGKRTYAKDLLECVVKSVGMGPESPSCWPLSDFPTIAVWPMDIESLITKGEDGENSPFEQLLLIATAAEKWPELGTCLAGEKCPYCRSRKQLSDDSNKASLLRILRWYELASGKRWSFRDLFTLTSYLLAGVTESGALAAAYGGPCGWAKHVKDMSSSPAVKQESLKLSAPFILVSAQYQHALFGRWPKLGVKGLRQAISDLKITDPDVNATLKGFYHFLNNNSKLSIPLTLESQLSSLCEILDPALAGPELMVDLSAKTSVPLRDIDARFSQSVGEGLRFIQKFQCLTPLEIDLLKRLDAVDQKLSEQDVAASRPGVAAWVQSLIRDFSCRLIRRSLGVRCAVVRDGKFLESYEKVVDGDLSLLSEAAKQLESYLNDNEKFEVVLNKTFGEPPPPISRRAILITAKQKVKPYVQIAAGRPKPAIRFLRVGSQEYQHPIPLTYELFKSVREMRAGMMPASLPRSVVALLDTTKAKLAGHIVRDEEQLDGSHIHIGSRSETIVRELQTFIVYQEGGL